MIYEDHVDDMLREWGRSAQEGTIRLGYKIGALGRMKGTTVKSASISLANYLRVDCAVSKLSESNEHLSTVAALIYINNMPYSEISKEIHKSKAAISGYRKQIIELVAKHLNLVDN